MKKESEKKNAKGEPGASIKKEQACQKKARESSETDPVGEKKSGKGAGKSRAINTLDESKTNSLQQGGGATYEGVGG